MTLFHNDLQKIFLHESIVRFITYTLNITALVYTTSSKPLIIVSSNHTGIMGASRLMLEVPTYSQVQHHQHSAERETEREGGETEKRREKEGARQQVNMLGKDICEGSE